MAEKRRHSVINSALALPLHKAKSDTRDRGDAPNGGGGETSSNSDRMQVSPPASPMTPTSGSSRSSTNNSGRSGGGGGDGGSSSSASARATASRERLWLASNRGGGVVGVSETPPTTPVSRKGSTSARTSTSVRLSPATTSTNGSDRPMCPLCLQSDGVHKFGYWLQKGSWVWLCSAEPRGSAGQGSGFCGHVFLEDRPRAECVWCGALMRVERHEDKMSYYCSTCRR